MEDDHHGPRPDGPAASPDPARPGAREGQRRRRAKLRSHQGLGVFTPPLVVRGLIAGAVAALTVRQGALFLASLADVAPPPSFALKAPPGRFLPQAASAGLLVEGAWGLGTALALILL